MLQRPDPLGNFILQASPLKMDSTVFAVLEIIVNTRRQEKTQLTGLKPIKVLYSVESLEICITTLPVWTVAPYHHELGQGPRG